MEKHGVTHFCGAPIVMNLLLHASQEHKRGKVDGWMDDVPGCFQIARI